ncbi:MAG: 3-phosphoserine/phosphohydroxythreonine transaminase [Paraglaciecola sp.]|uniref:3-phosphoserine/phosphohydroxythreonine transaminase n=1 Tax=Paraglaciecola sp. TaxID=1920173 RepID=UPI00273F2CC3|nr:3-phosphoserine/phosphohydroxythreonine transaminase [Paraglaciecola sp.]MDP5031045.1 3-phosphoserine/phosphohydroxythreonine transaminase [Paraglaciecola sp.]MDP5131348.1 3-phosphoserine/phosphohydroxythreonine transaminase [Paraglaciecola sp.]
MSDIFNFCAGPAMLPTEVMQQAQAEFINWQGLGCSVMEISHRSKEFIALAEQSEQDLRDLLNVPKDYAVLFAHGGGRGQFSAVPQNLAHADQSAAYLINGSWSEGAHKEGSKYLNAQVIGRSVIEQGLALVPEINAADIDQSLAYYHYCPNETVEGMEINWLPDSGNVPLVADMSSCILSKEIDVSKFGVIYAGAQKNIGPSGLSVVLVRNELLDQARDTTPSFMHYKTMANFQSMYNTPPTYAWYLAGLVFKWLKAKGGVAAIEKINNQKAAHLYDCIDGSDFYLNHVHADYRSRMNVVFHLADPTLDALFLSEAEKAGLRALKGHRIVGGMRASIYNAMPLEGVKVLTEFMREFARSHG